MKWRDTGLTPERVGISEATLIAGIPKRTLQAFAASAAYQAPASPLVAGHSTLKNCAAGRER
jgi:hypothetical protein